MSAFHTFGSEWPHAGSRLQTVDVMSDELEIIWKEAVRA
jgi:hypothetical protein